MLYYEVKKFFSRRGNQVALAALVVLLAVVSWLAIHSVDWVDEEGETISGISASRRLRDAQSQWEGPLTEERIAAVLRENARINQTKEGQSENVRESNIAYGWKQGFSEIRDLINRYYGGFRDYDYYRADSLDVEAASQFYSNRVGGLKTWLSGEAKEQFSDAEKAFLIEQYESLETPLKYSYVKGWESLCMYAPTLLMVMTLIGGFLVSGIFSGESQMKADAIFYSTYHGRGKAVLAKVKAGFFLTTGIYWVTVLLYSALVLGALGGGGADTMIQASSAGWKSFYHITHGQLYLLLAAGGYIGILFILSASMLLSALTKSAVLTVMLPFILIFAPSLLSGLGSGSWVEKVVGLMPDQLLQMQSVTQAFHLYSIGGRVAGAVGILMVLYGLLSILLQPAIYWVFKRKEVA